MEDRLERDHTERPGAALTALAVVLAVTAAWWALALWPMGANEPEWLVRTRGACFGSQRGGLPDAGGWILLVGEPFGMLGLISVIWGRSLQRDLRRIIAKPSGRVAVITVTMAVLVTAPLLGVRTARAWASGRVSSVRTSYAAAPQRVDRAAPVVSFVDQDGRRTSFADFAGRTTMLTFAYGHCTTVCPSIVNDLRAARRTANRPDVPLVIVTLDPWRDTPDRLTTLAQHWRLGPRDRMLSGSIPEVESALDSLGIGRRRNETTGDIDHGTTTFILDDRARIAWRIDGGAFGVAELLRRSPLQISRNEAQR